MPEPRPIDLAAIDAYAFSVRWAIENVGADTAALYARALARIGLSILGRFDERVVGNA